jgi:calcineurin-like phosphoesterase family protein
MKTTWFTSDLHFGHKNILKYNPKTRPFVNVDDMTYEMSKAWNRAIKAEDEVYILGDVAFLSAKEACKIIGNLNGEKHLIVGNHDRGLSKDPAFRALFFSVQDYKELVYDDTRFVMFHYPIVQWNLCHYGAIHLHGHLHGAPSGLEQYKAFDVGVDSTGKIAISADELIKLSKTRDTLNHGSE